MSLFPLPELDFDNEAFWTGGAAGELRIYRCRACGFWLHPPRPVCRACLSTDVGAEAASGMGAVATYTVNRQPWLPGLEVPYVLAIVELDEQPGLRLMTNIVNCSAEAVKIGMRVRVVFEQREDVWIPLFEPVSA